jgi:hypothetical protein
MRAQEILCQCSDGNVAYDSVPRLTKADLWQTCDEAQGVIECPSCGKLIVVSPFCMILGLLEDAAPENGEDFDDEDVPF